MLPPNDPFAPEALAEALAGVLGHPLPVPVPATLHLVVQAHAGQLRKARDDHERLPYVVHPFDTALRCVEHYPLVALEDDLGTVVCVALAHDVLEDTSVPPATVEAVAGPRVRRCVEALTRAAATEESERMPTADFAAGIVAAGHTAVFVKLCDSMSNLSRPDLVPLQLLGRLVDKAHRYYLPMLDACDLGPAMRDVYCAAIAAAEGELVSAAAAD